MLRKRRSDDHERFIEVLGRSAIDPNPHQLEGGAPVARAPPPPPARGLMRPTLLCYTEALVFRVA
ncbi:MAG: hypothetical protein AB1758_26025 [Candidatus Eremiobacterota bacterium]